jgi:hypothetical protein
MLAELINRVAVVGLPATVIQAALPPSNGVGERVTSQSQVDLEVPVELGF